MREVGSREFQLTYQRLTEPVKVITRSGGTRVIGYFYPGEVPPEIGRQETLVPQDTLSLEDALKALPSQDRKFMERKMGKKK